MTPRRIHIRRWIIFPLSNQFAKLLSDQDSSRGRLPALHGCKCSLTARGKHHGKDSWKMWTNEHDYDHTHLRCWKPQVHGGHKTRRGPAWILNDKCLWKLWFGCEISPSPSARVSNHLVSGWWHRLERLWNLGDSGLARGSQLLLGLKGGVCFWFQPWLSPWWSAIKQIKKEQDLVDID